MILDAAARIICTSFLAEPRRADYANPRLVGAACRFLEEVALERRHRPLLRPITLAAPARESAPESLSAGHFELAGLPRPECQPVVRTPIGVVYPDFLWRDRRLIGECDGAIKYDDREAILREKRREQALRDLGFGVVRWLASEIMTRPDEVVGRVGRAIESRMPI